MPPRTNDVLNRIFVTLYRSLPMYMQYASPWTHQGDGKAVATIQHMVADCKSLCQRIVETILDHHGRIEFSEYPLSFTSTHDVALDYLIGMLIECQQRDIQIMERCVSQLQDDPPARALAEEALGAARGHLENLEELRGLTVNSAAFR